MSSNGESAERDRWRLRTRVLRGLGLDAVLKSRAFGVALRSVNENGYGADRAKPAIGARALGSDALFDTV